MSMNTFIALVLYVLGGTIYYVGRLIMKKGDAVSITEDAINKTNVSESEAKTGIALAVLAVGMFVVITWPLFIVQNARYGLCSYLKTREKNKSITNKDL